MNEKAFTRTCDTCCHYTADCDALGSCDLMGYVNDIDEDHPRDETRAYAWDYEGYSAGVYVGPKFGCIHWAPASPEQLLKFREIAELKRLREKLKGKV